MEWIVVVVVCVIAFAAILIGILHRRGTRQVSPAMSAKVPPERRPTKPRSKRAHNQKAIRELLSLAYTSKQRLAMQYETGNPLPGEPAIKVRNVDIYGLGEEYFDAYCHYRCEVRTFKISRVLWSCLANETYDVPNTYVASTWVTEGWGDLEDLEDRRLESAPGVIQKRSYLSASRKKERQHRISREQVLSRPSEEKSRSYTRYDWQKRWEESIATPFPEEWTPALPYLYEVYRLEREGADQRKIREVLEKARKADSQATAFYTGRRSIIKKVRDQRRHKSRAKE